MEENKDFFDFGSEDIFSSSAGNAKEYEDIVSRQQNARKALRQEKARQRLYQMVARL